MSTNSLVNVKAGQRPLITLQRLLKDGIYSTPHIRVLVNATYQSYIFVSTKKRRKLNSVKNSPS